MEKDQDKPKMPLRNKGHEVDLIHMPGKDHPTLGYTYSSKDCEVDVRAQSTLQWEHNSYSPRRQVDQAAPIDVELNLRVRTSLSYEASEEISNEVNRMHTEPKNEPRKTEEKSARERISVKIGF